MYDIVSLMFSKENDKPGWHFTPIWNVYLKRGCVAKMTKEEALKQKLFFFGDLKKAVEEVARTRAWYAEGLMRDGKPRAEAKEEAAQNFPFEFLFHRMM